jgi:chitinase
VAATQRLVVRVVNHDFALTTSALRAWQRVKGTLRIRANVRGAKTGGIGLYVDGRVVSRDRVAPYTVRWNSRKVHDGRHWITLAAVADDGRIAKRRLPLVVENHPLPKKPKPKPKPLPPPQVTAQNLADGQTVSGSVDWRAHTIGPVARVEFVVDGTVIASPTTEPWTTTWDSTTVVAGAHTLEVRAYTRDGRSAVLTVTVTSTGT